MPPIKRNNVVKTKEEIIASLSETTPIDPVQQQILEALLDIRDSMDSMPGNRRLRMMERQRFVEGNPRL